MRYRPFNFITLTIWVIVMHCFLPTAAQAALHLSINKGSESKTNISIEKDIFVEKNSHHKRNKYLSKNILTIIRDDLISSDLFNILNYKLHKDSEFDNQPNFLLLRHMQSRLHLMMQITNHDSNKNTTTLHVKLWNPYEELLVANQSFEITDSNMRSAAHKISNLIYETITGDNGHFDTSITFVAELKHKNIATKQLAIMDYDGHNLRYITDGKNLDITPRFNSNNDKIIYLSYIKKKPHITIIDTKTNEKEIIQSADGISFAPRFSPDNNYVIFSKTIKDTTAIYELNLLTKYAKKILYDRGCINTSPSYSYDGQKIAFNSNRSGSRQIYIMNKDGSNITRLSYGKGVYATPVWSPKGDKVAFTKMLNGQFHIGVIDINTEEEKILSSSWMEESPTWSPNGHRIIFHRQNRSGKNQLYSVDMSGKSLKGIKTKISASDPYCSNA